MIQWTLHFIKLPLVLQIQFVPPHLLTKLQLLQTVLSDCCPD